MKNTLVKALKSAGEIQRRSYQTANAISEKESISSVLTEVDLESEAKIMETIENKFPGHNILSEECGFIDRSSEFTWVIDPLDGTSNYAAGLPWFGVLIALMKGNAPILAGAYLPLSDSMYLSEAGEGASVNGKVLKIENQEISKTLVSFSTDFSADDRYVKKSADLYGFMVQHARNVRSTNCLLDMLYVAEGRFGGCINMFTHIWDIAPLFLIITEAGGIFKSLDMSDIEFMADAGHIHKNYPVVTGCRSFVESMSAVL